MAKGKNNNQKEKSSAKSETARPRFALNLKPETRRGIWAVVIFLLAILTLFSLFEFAGVVGEVWRRFLGVLFGLGTLIMPLAFAAAGVLVLRGNKFEHLRARAVGLLVTMLGLFGIFHLWTEPSEMVGAASAGQGGGWFGLLLAWPLRSGLGFWAGLVVLIAVALIGLLLLFDVGLSNLFPKRAKREEEVTVKGIGEEKKSGLLQNVFKRKSVVTTEQAGATENGEAGGDAGEVGDESDEETDEARGKETDEESADENNGKETGAGTKAKQSAEAEPDITIRNVPGEALASGPVLGPALQVKDMTYTPPTLDLLDSKMARPTAGDIKANVRLIRRTLENFGIPVEMGDVSIGPTVTQYTFKPAEGVKLATITSLQNDLALALAAHPVRIEAPIPGKSLVGLEVPNIGVALVRLREILASEPFVAAKEPLTIALGRDVAGNPYVGDLAKMPHLLIAGATGSGKSVAINTLLMSLLYRNSPQTLKLILVDPKRVELTHYNGLPHLITPVIIEAKKTIAALRWCVAEMDKRYELLNASGKRNIASYNAYATGQKLPYIAVVIDELADLMAVAANDVEAAIVRLAQMARAVGIHLIVATQRPSVDVITGLIKANITSRMAFNVASSIDSRTILDHSGAEKLLGNGDMLYITAQLSKPKRIQGAFVTEGEVERVTDFLREKIGEPEYVDAVTDGGASSRIGAMSGSSHTAGAFAAGAEDDDPMLEEAKKVIIENQKASASLLQRRLSVGYARAARLLDLMEERGWIGPGQGAKPREVFIGKGDPDTGIDMPDDLPPPPPETTSSESSPPEFDGPPSEDYK